LSMTGNYCLLAPVTAALNIREAYHRDVERILSAVGLGEDIIGQIITDSLDGRVTHKEFCGDLYITVALCDQRMTFWFARSALTS